MCPSTNKVTFLCVLMLGSISTYGATLDASASHVERNVIYPLASCGCERVSEVAMWDSVSSLRPGLFAFICN